MPFLKNCRPPHTPIPNSSSQSSNWATLAHGSSPAPLLAITPHGKSPASPTGTGAGADILQRCFAVTWQFLKAKPRLDGESVAPLTPCFPVCAGAVNTTPDPESPPGMGQSSDEGRATRGRAQGTLGRRAENQEGMARSLRASERPAGTTWKDLGAGHGPRSHP